MRSLSKDQKIALLAVPMLLYGVLGVHEGEIPYSTAGEVTEQKEVSKHVSLKRSLSEALMLNDYALFRTALTSSPYEYYATREVFDVLVASFDMEKGGRTRDTQDSFIRMLYS